MNINTDLLNEYQKEQVNLGIKNGLTENQISVYAKPIFDVNQMEEIRLGFENGLTMEQVSIYAKPEFNYSQMNIIRTGFEQGLSIEQVLLFAKPEYDRMHMLVIRSDLLNGYTKEDIDIYINTVCFSSIIELSDLLQDKDKLTKEQIEFLSKNTLRYDNYNDNNKDRLKWFEIYMIRKLFLLGYEIEQVKQLRQTKTWKSVCNEIDQDTSKTEIDMYINKIIESIKIEKFLKQSLLIKNKENKIKPVIKI